MNHVQIIPYPFICHLKDGKLDLLIKRAYSQNTTCVENMVYSATETTFFGLYWPSSAFYNIKEEFMKAVKTVRGC